MESRSSYISSHSSQERSSSRSSSGLFARRLALGLVDLEHRVLEHLDLDELLEVGDGHREDAQPLVDLGREGDLVAQLRALREFHSASPRGARPGVGGRRRCKKYTTVTAPSNRAATCGDCCGRRC